MCSKFVNILGGPMCPYGSLSMESDKFEISSKRISEIDPGFFIYICRLTEISISQILV